LLQFDILLLLSSFWLKFSARREVLQLHILFDVLLGVLISVIAHSINKWLDSKDKKDS